MKAIHYLIIEVDSAYENEEQNIIVNSTIENVDFVNRIARVISSPKGTILEKGDEVIVHHNILRLRNNVKGGVQASNYFLEGNKYFVPLTEVFMYRRGGDWIPIEPYVFVKPIEVNTNKGFDLSLSESSHKGMIKRKGILSHPNRVLLEQGAKKGDIVRFSEYSEYEFNIEGVVYYKMSHNDILYSEN